MTLVGVGALMPEVLAAQLTLASQGLVVGVVCLTSPDLVYPSFDGRGDAAGGREADIASVLFPAFARAPIVSVMDGHPHTLSFLAGIRGDAVRCLGVRDFGQASSLPDAYAHHGIDVPAVVGAALRLTGR